MSEQKEPRMFYAHLYNDDYTTVFGKQPEEKKLEDIVAEWRKEVKQQQKEETVNDTQVGGNHYKIHGVQPWDIIEQYNLNFFAGNVVKYILRYQYKNGLEDLQKAEHYIKKLIELEKAKT